MRRLFAPHELRDAHAVEMAREGVPLIVIQRQLGHSNLGYRTCPRPSHESRASWPRHGATTTLDPGEIVTLPGRDLDCGGE